MLPKKNRLSREEISGVLSKGRTVSGAHMRLKSMPANLPAFAVTIPKKVISGAVSRNRARRRIYAALKDSVGQKVPLQGLIFVQTDISRLPYQVIADEIQALVRGSQGKVMRKTA
jgi:ribonuclease P protein component